MMSVRRETLSRSKVKRKSGSFLFFETSKENSEIKADVLTKVLPHSLPERTVRATI